ncbi:MAG: ABC transporter ATP-binding protein [Clostridia bacterium]|nr:ABC transporter ATP-binding protein [Clostridia bacterium]
MEKTARLALVDLSVGYGGRAVVQGINVSAEAGEIVTLIGPNGAGKSTVLKTVCRRLRPLSGRVELSGEDAHAMTARQAAARMAVLLTRQPAPDLITCFEVAALGRYPHTGRLGRLTQEDRDIVEESLRQAGAWEIRQSDFSRISDGQRQRVLLARALCQQPEVLLLDEPTTFLDLGGKIALMEVLHALAKERGVSIVLTLHETELAREISDKVLCLKGGRVHALGTPEQVFTPGNMEELFDLPQGVYTPGRGIRLRMGHTKEGEG